jgi:hypothetical protein
MWGACVAISKRDFAFSRHDLPEVCMNAVPPRREGAGNAGCALHPRSRVQRVHKETHTSIQVQRRQSGIPCAVVLRLMPRSPRRRIRLVTVTAGLMVIPIRLDRYSHRQLGTSNGCRDHTVLPYANSAVRLARREPLTGSLPCGHLARRRCRVHRIPSRVRDDSRSAPLWVGRRELVELICPTG